MSENQTKKPGKGKRGRPRTRHGGYALLTRGELPQNRLYLRPYLTEVREGLIRDLAAREEELTMAQRVLVDRVVTFLGVVRLIEEMVKEKGIFETPAGLLNPALATNYLAYNNSIRLTLQVLGINRQRVERGPTLADIIREGDEAAAKNPQDQDPAAVAVQDEPGDVAGAPADLEDPTSGELENLSLSELQAMVRDMERKRDEPKEKRNASGQEDGDPGSSEDSNDAGPGGGAVEGEENE